MSKMGYWKWLYDRVTGITRDEFKMMWWFVRVLGGMILIVLGCELISFYLIDNNAIAFVVALVSGVFFGATWYAYNVEKD